MNVWKKYGAVLGLAMALPATILGTSYLVFAMIKEKIIPEWVGLLIIVLVVFNSFYLMIRYVVKRKN